MADRATFNNDVKTVLDDHRETTAAFILRLKKLSPSQFARLPRKDLERLTYAQYGEIAKAILPDAPIRKPEAPEVPPEVGRSWGEVWASLSLWQRSAALMAAATMGAFAIVLGGPVAWKLVNPPLPITRSKAAYDWPYCQRLTLQTDGCRYTPTQSLNWDYVAAELGMEKSVLLDINPNLSRQYAPAGQPIVIWRGVSKLRN